MIYVCFCSAPTLWHSLPGSVKSPDNVNTIRSYLNFYFLTQHTRLKPLDYSSSYYYKRLWYCLELLPMNLERHHMETIPQQNTTREVNQAV